jgi:hypothetical protein
MLVFVAITDDVERAATEFLDFLSATVSRYGGEVGDVDVRLKTLIESPVLAIGSIDEICDKLRTMRDSLGVSATSSCPTGPPLQISRPSSNS